MPTLRVTYLELLAPPRPPDQRRRAGPERIASERLGLEAYLDLYRRVGGPLRWDQRLRMAPAELAALLAGGRLTVHVARGAGGEPLGLCELDAGGFPEVELVNFGLIPEAQGRGLGPRLLHAALAAAWDAGARRIWLHTDEWDHPAAVPVYRHAGFEIYAVREEDAERL